MISMKDKILYLINPEANEKAAKNEWRKAQRRFPTLPKEPVNIYSIPDLTAYIKAHAPEVITIIGGDGTVNYVCKSILPLKKRPLLAILPFGYGNAMAFSLGVNSLDRAIHVLSTRPSHVTIDLLKTNIPDFPIGTFNVSAGFDARIVHHRMNDRYIGLRSYFLSAIRSLFTHAENKISFTVDHVVKMHATASSLVIANSPIIGLNFVVSDEAKMNDGFLDCTIFSTKFTYITNLRLRGFKHPLYSTKGKVQFKAKHIKIEGEPLVQIDGDPVVLKAPLEVEVMPSAVTFLANDIQYIQIPEAPFLVN